jgi:hypothetical protein
METALSSCLLVDDLARQLISYLMLRGVFMAASRFSGLTSIPLISPVATRPHSFS